MIYLTIWAVVAFAVYLDGYYTTNRGWWPRSHWRGIILAAIWPLITLAKFARWIREE